MRTHGWGGDPPGTDEEAITRITQAAVACVTEHANGADISRVAARLGVTRQTVYRYFPTRNALFEAVAAQASENLMKNLKERVIGIANPTDAIVEILLFCIREVPNDPQLSFIARPGRGDALITSAQAPALADAFLGQLPIELGDLTDVEQMHLAEHMVRLLQALLLDPTTADRDEADLRAFLNACFSPSTHT